MLDIEYKGANGVIISTKNTTIVSDPKLSVAGLHDLKTDDAIELATEQRFSLDNKKSRLSIEGPGEYEVGEFSIKGVGATRHLDTADQLLSTIYRIDNGEIRIALLGNIAPKLSDEQLEEIGLVDVLVIPVGGNGYTLDATSAASIVRSIDPKAVVPVHYADDTIKYEVPQDALELFAKELGAPLETVAKYKLKSSSLLPTTLTVVEITKS